MHLFCVKCISFEGNSAIVCLLASYFPTSSWHVAYKRDGPHATPSGDIKGRFSHLIINSVKMKPSTPPATTCHTVNLLAKALAIVSHLKESSLAKPSGAAGKLCSIPLSCRIFCKCSRTLLRTYRRCAVWGELHFKVTRSYLT